MVWPFERKAGSSSQPRAKSDRAESKGIVKVTDCRLFSAFLHEAKPFKLRRAAIDNLPGFRVNPANLERQANR